MTRQLRRLEKGDEAILLVGATAPRDPGFSQTGRLERRTGRWAVVGVLALTLGTSMLGLVYASRTQSASAIRKSVAPATPPPAPHSSVLRPEVARGLTMQLHSPSPAMIKKRERTASRVGDDAQEQEATLSFTPHGLTFNLTGSRPTASIIRTTAWDRKPIAQEEAAVSTRQLVTLDFVGANQNVVPQWQQPTSETISPLRDPQPLEKIERPAAPTLRYREVWPGIDLLYAVTGDRLRSIFVVKPGADPNQIQFAYHGVTAIRHTKVGQLEVSTPMGSFAEDAPVAYQESLHLARLAGLRDGVSWEMRGVDHGWDEQRVAVAAAYTLQPSKETPVWGIHVGVYDPNTPLIIERTVRYPGSNGGNDTDIDADRTTDRDGAAFTRSAPTPLNRPTP